MILTIGTILLFLLLEENLISMYLQERVLRSRSQIRLSMESSIWILCCWIAAVYDGADLFQHSERVRRDCSAMKAGVVAICVNLLFNYLLIYGVFSSLDWV